MKYLLDESADFRLRPALIQHGHDVYSESRDFAFSTPDVDVLAIAVRQGMVIITEDPD